MNHGLQKTQQRYLGIIGHRLSHTLSPAMHTAAFKKLNLDYVYGVMDVQSDFLPGAISSMSALNFRGVNVTVPHKQAVVPFLDEISKEAKIIGAVNTIVHNNGKLIGYNTDVDGVTFSLKKYSSEIMGKSVVIFGAGGATRATVYALVANFSPHRITLVNRTLDHAQKLVDVFQPQFPTTNFFVTNNDNTTIREIDSAILLINTTSIGMKPHVKIHPLPAKAVIQPKHIVFDIVYNPMYTSLLTMAHNSGARVIGGVEMLLGQGEKAFELFTNQHFPLETAREALSKELR
ncbi:MAG: shikimate dehydrogenase [Bacteroidota bacterium]|nr:shikimate dehydrogenase [Bacteroidota bacterium]